MATVAELLAQRADLASARNSGALRTTFKSGGTERTTEYKSDAEMAAAIADLDRRITNATARGASPRTVSFVTSKGF